MITKRLRGRNAHLSSPLHVSTCDSTAEFWRNLWPLKLPPLSLRSKEGGEPGIKIAEPPTFMQYFSSGLPSLTPPPWGGEGWEERGAGGYAGEILHDTFLGQEPLRPTKKKKVKFWNASSRILLRSNITITLVVCVFVRS